MKPHQCHICDRQYIELIDLAAHIMEDHKLSEKTGNTQILGDRND